MIEDELEARIEATISEYLAEKGGGLIGSWFMVGNFTDTDGAPSWLYKTSPGQDGITTMGLVHWAAGIATYEQRRHLEDIEAHGE